MGKPRLIILIRHAQSEGNKNREVHQVVPDHRVKLTDEGWRQAEEAGRRLRTLLHPDDTLQIYTSPYRRTRETTEGILSTLTAKTDYEYNYDRGNHHDENQTNTPAPPTSPSPFSRSKIKVYEEPRLREQDFGNFQPGADEMERMWAERADYGHFFYRIPNGESAADAYDRISGFNESLWRQFGEDDFPSVCVLVTHGLMSRVFLMKWYHWSVEYFEDLRNVNHCEFVVMRRREENGRYALQNQLRTWSELKRLRALEAKGERRVVGNPLRRNTLSAFLKHEDRGEGEGVKGVVAVEGAPMSGEASGAVRQRTATEPALDGLDGSADTAESNSTKPLLHPTLDTSGSNSGTTTPHEMPDESSYFERTPTASAGADPIPRGGPRALAQALRRPLPQRKATPEDVERWVRESGMGRGRLADGLGDEPAERVEEEVGVGMGGN